MEKISYKGTNTYILTLAFIWLSFFKYNEYDNPRYLLIKFVVFLVLIYISTLFGDKESIEIQGENLLLTQKKVKFLVKINKIINVEMIELDRELVITTEDTKYNYRAYKLGKDNIENFFEAHGLLINKNM